MSEDTQISELGLAEGATPWIGPNGKIMERLELHLTYTCPERCVFCSEADRMQRYKQFPVTWGRIATILRTHAERGVKAVHLTGGEPTIHPGFWEIIGALNEHGIAWDINSHVRTFSDPEFAARARREGLGRAIISLHSHLVDELNSDGACRMAVLGGSAKKEGVKPSSLTVQSSFMGAASKSTTASSRCRGSKGSCAGDIEQVAGGRLQELEVEEHVQIRFEFSLHTQPFVPILMDRKTTVAHVVQSGSADPGTGTNSKEGGYRTVGLFFRLRGVGESV